MNEYHLEWLCKIKYKNLYMSVCMCGMERGKIILQNYRCMRRGKRQ